MGALVIDATSCHIALQLKQITVLGVVLCQPRHYLLNIYLALIVLDMTKVLLCEELHQRLEFSSDGMREEGIILNEDYNVLGPVHQTLGNVASIG